MLPPPTAAQRPPQRPASAPTETQRQPAAAAAPPASAAGTATFPVVRRNGYDRATVDARVHQLSSEKAGLSASLSQSEPRVLELEQALEQAKGDLTEMKSPSYAGLGGRASTMLRLAEEEADEIREVAQATPPRSAPRPSATPGRSAPTRAARSRT